MLSNHILNEIRKLPDGVGLSLGLGGSRRRHQGRRLVEQPDKLRCETMRRHMLLLDTPTAPRFGKAGRVFELITVERMRQRYEDRRAADDGKLGHRRRAGARDNQVAVRHDLGQALEKRRDLGVDAGR